MAHCLFQGSKALLRDVAVQNMPSLALGVDVPSMGVPMNAAMFELADASKYGAPQRPFLDLGMDARSDKCINGLLFGHLTLELSGARFLRVRLDDWLGALPRYGERNVCHQTVKDDAHRDASKESKEVERRALVDWMRRGAHVTQRRETL